MSSVYESNDKQLVEKVARLLVERTYININDDVGVACYGGNEEQSIYPKVCLTKEDIRSETGRKNVRDSAMESIRRSISDKGFDTLLDENGIVVSVPQNLQKDVTDFSNLRTLEIANEMREKEYQDSRNEYETEEEFRDNDPKRPFWK